MTTLILSVTMLLNTNSAPLVDFPAPVKGKELYAQNDLRGKKAPQLHVEQWLSGNLENTRGKVLFIDFWATWCGPCVKSIPELNEWQEKFKDDLVVIGLSNEQPDVVKKFMESTKMNYRVAIDTQGRTSKEVGVKGIPHVLIISKDGIVRWQGFPGSNEEKLTTELLKQIIDANKALK